MRIAVIGGGISGISAAIYAREAMPEADVSLLEAGGRLGGVIETLNEPYLIEKGADNFATLMPDALELSRLCGVDEQLIMPQERGRQAFVLSRGRLEPIPAGFSLMQPTRILSILTTRTLSFGGKLRLLREFLVPARKEDGDESLESFVTRRLGREAFENLVEPIVSGIFTADPSTLSMQATMPQFLEMERTSGGLIRGHLSAKRKDARAAARRASGARYDQFRAPKLGMNAWIEGLAGHLPATAVRLGSPVRRLQHMDESAWKLTIDCNGQSHDEQFDAVICTAPARVASRLLESVDREAAESIGKIEYASSAVAAMIVRRADIGGRIDGFGMIVPSVAGRKTLAISYTSNKYPGRTPDELVLLRVFLGGAKDPTIMELEDAAIEEIAQHEVREILNWTGDPEWISIVRWNKAMPQYTVGHVDRVNSIFRRLEQFPTLGLAGAAYRGVGIPQCVRSGRLAAEKVTAYLAAPAG